MFKIVKNKNYSFYQNDNINQIALLKNELQTNLNESNDINKYSKNNKFIFGKKACSCKKFSMTYKIIKYLLVTLVAIFAMLSLWYVTQWKKDTLKNLGVDFTKFLDEKKDQKLSDILDQTRIDELNLISSLSLTQWKSTRISGQILDLLLSFSFIGLICIIPSLVFKNGTIFSVVSLSMLLISLIIILTTFFMGINEQQKIISIYNKSSNPQMANTIFDQILGLIK